MKRKVKARPVQVGMVALGCAKNLVDAEIMLGTLLKEGMEITNDAASADALIVNTCSFIDSAQEESIDAILESAAVREAKARGQALIVAGCLPQRFREELTKLLPEVDAFMGIDQVAQVSNIIREALERRAERISEKPDSAGGWKRHEETAGQGRGVLQGQGTWNLARRQRVKTQLAEIEGRNDAEQSHAPCSGNTSPAPIFAVKQRPQYIPDFATPRFRLTPRYFAYVKIAEGCNHPCSFCIIPQMRGSHRSRQQADIVAEARVLIADGVKELNLISQDSTYYGLDLRPNHSQAIAAPERFTKAVRELPAQASTICSLLRELNDLEGDFWIRLLYTHPAHWTDELIETIAECPKVARYVDIPLQHIHENMLERMRRETSEKYIVELIERIRRGVPGIALRTTLIVGFPGETEEYFGRLLEFIRAVRFERLGVFAYSQQEGTRAGKMEGQVPERIKRQRRDRAMEAQQEVAKSISAGFVGRTIRVLVEKEATAQDLKNARISSWEHGLIRAEEEGAIWLKGKYFIARGEADAPDIDGRVYVGGEATVGEFADVMVTEHTDYDLVARAV